MVFYTYVYVYKYIYIYIWLYLCNCIYNTHDPMYLVVLEIGVGGVSITRSRGREFLGDNTPRKQNITPLAEILRIPTTVPLDDIRCT